LPAERVIAEHYRLGSTCAILSRSFCNTGKITDVDTVRDIFENGLKEIRAWEQECESGRVDFVANRREVEMAVEQIVQK